MTSASEFREFGKQMIDYIADYLENIRDRNVLPDVEPGYMQQLIPDEAPENPEKWQDVMADIERIIMPGVTHWQSPQFHAYFPTGCSYPSIVADMLSDAISCVGFTWIASPSCTELEMHTMDWLGKMLNLPPQFLFSGTLENGEKSKGGGVIQCAASDVSLVAVLAARSRMISQYRESHPKEEVEDGQVMSKLVMYLSKNAHCSVERAGMLAGVKTRLLDVDENESLRGDTVVAAIEEDRAKGMIPFCLIATLGSTNCLAMDNIAELGPICQKEKIWIHIDAAYAGGALICEEYRYLLDGVEFCDSFNFNAHKMLLTNFDCSCMWVQDSSALVDTFNVDPTYLKHEYQGQIPDYRHWQIPLGRRFRSLKLWFVLRLYGQAGMRSHVRKMISFAKHFETLVKADERFELTHPVLIGLVCFRLKGSEELNKELNKRVNAGRKIHITPSHVGSMYILRFVVCNRDQNSDDIELAWNEISNCATKLLEETNSK